MSVLAFLFVLLFRHFKYFVFSKFYNICFPAWPRQMIRQSVLNFNIFLYFSPQSLLLSDVEKSVGLSLYKNWSLKSQNYKSFTCSSRPETGCPVYSHLDTIKYHPVDSAWIVRGDGFKYTIILNRGYKFYRLL